MAENLILNNGNREEKYKTVIPQLKALTEGEPDYIANCANISAALRQTFGFFWVGFYFVKENELVLGPFQGEIACTRIQFGKGVCGKAWESKETIIVQDVNEFDGHIACSSASLSEIVIPIIKNGKVRSVIDVDSDKKNNFDNIDEKYLNQIAAFLADLF